MTDNEKLEKIVSLCQAGNEEAFHELVDMYSDSLYGYFYRLTGNSEISKDLLSELFIKLIKKIGYYKGGSFRKWIFKVASNLFYDYLRHRYRQQKLIDGKVSTMERNTYHHDATPDLRDELDYYMAKLDDDTAEILMLRFYGGLSFKELAEQRSEPIGTTLSKVHRGLKKMRKLMDGEQVKARRKRLENE